MLCTLGFNNTSRLRQSGVSGEFSLPKAEVQTPSKRVWLPHSEKHAAAGGTETSRRAPAGAALCKAPAVCQDSSLGGKAAQDTAGAP